MAIPPLPTKTEIWAASDGTQHPTQLAAYVRSMALFLVEAVGDMPATFTLEALLTEQVDMLWDAVNAVKHMAAGRDPDKARIP